MFNFLFDGKIGDILAPVVPSNQLHLAIQHFKNDQILGLLNSTGYIGSQQPAGAYSAIHVACRYNNKYALDLLVQRGTSLQLTDQNGNSALHYAAKYGHLELCKYLIESGGLVAAKNHQQQTPYDVAESHVVRQYLLPLQLQAERGGDVSIPPPPPSVFVSQPTATIPVHNQTPTNTFFPPSGGGSNQLPTTVAGAPPPATAGIPVTYYAPPPPIYSHNQGLSKAPASTGSVGSNRIIQPDGFHSSASDPVLQQKYGHVIEQKHVAPPPTGPVAFTSSAPPLVQGGGASIYNRYVPYDINAAAGGVPAQPFPPQQPPLQPPSYTSTSAMQAVAPSIMQPPLPSATRAGISNPAVLSRQVSGSSTNSSASGSVPPNTVSTPTSVNRLLGNKAVAVNISSFDEGLSPVSRPNVDSPSNSAGKQNISFSRDDGEVIQASSNSSSIL